MTAERRPYLRSSGRYATGFRARAGAENSEVLPALSVAVAVTLGPATPSGLPKVQAPAGPAVVVPS
jgi:hypothetical protein